MTAEKRREEIRALLANAGGPISASTLAARFSVSRQVVVGDIALLRAAGLETPVIPGILPIQSFDSLRRVLSLCGANIPGKLYLELEAAHNEGGVEAVREAGLRFAARQIRQLLDCGAPGIHLYSLNKSEMCLRLVEEAGL